VLTLRFGFVVVGSGPARAAIRFPLLLDFTCRSLVLGRLSVGNEVSPVFASIIVFVENFDT